ncbi:TonB-dependent receptor [Sphingomonas sp.]|uniref:TonB-dependent receptor n=1 Tax=Sphingomonas sp. TaxID=28214 RepID=UPI003B3A723C
MRVRSNKAHALRVQPALAAIALGLLSTSAYAQSGATVPAEPAANTDDASSDIIVTAQRRRETIQSVPIAITAITGQTLKTQNIQSVQDYFALTPNVSFQSNGSRDRKDLIIRGISNQLSPYSDVRQASYAFYIDEFNVAAGTSNPEIVDLDRIEVLRGPQGTYFGRNSVGGAINIITKKPVNQFEGEIGGSYSSFDTRRVQGVLNVPIVNDLLAVRASGQFEKSDGNIKNINPIGGGNNHKFYTGRIEARLTPASNLTWDFNYSYSHETDGMRDGVPTGFVTSTWASIYYGGTPGFIANPDGVGFYPDNDNRVNFDRPQKVGSKYQYESTHLVWDLGGVSVTGVLGHISSNLFNYGDVDGGSHDYFYENLLLKRGSTSGELRLQSNGSHFLDWSIGTSLGRDTGHLNQFTYNGTESPFGPDGSQITGALSNSSTRYFAVFAQGTLNFTDKFSAVVGGRYSHERTKNYSYDSSGGIITDVNDRSASFNDFSPKLTLDYKANPNLLFYATVSRGFKSGGTQTTNDVNLRNDFKPETLWNYEAGTKFDLLNHRLRLDVAAFYMDWRNIQENIQFQYVDPATGLLKGVGGIANAARARSYGVEGSFDFQVTKAFKLSGQVGYNNARYRKYDNALIDGTVVDASGRPLIGAPKWTLGAQGQYTYPIGDKDDIFLRAEWNHRSKMLSSAYALKYYQYPFISPSYNNVNLRLGTDIGPIQAIVYVQNLFKAHYYANAYEKAFYSGVQVEPSFRTIGLSLNYKF